MGKPDPKKTSIFWKIFWGILLITIFSNLIFAYIIYNAYEGILIQVKPFLSTEFFSNIEVNINSTWLIAASSFLFVIVMATLLTFLFAGRILRPLKRLLSFVQEISKGNLEVKAKAGAKVEYTEP